MFAPRHVTAARHYLERNLAERVSMATLTRVTGVSERTLQSGFRRWFDQTPMEYLRERRLEEVHRALLAAPPGTRVFDIFLRCSIADFGRYARFCRARFGKSPSQELRGAGVDPPVS